MSLWTCCKPCPSWTYRHKCLSKMWTLASNCHPHHPSPDTFLKLIVLPSTCFKLLFLPASSESGLSEPLPTWSWPRVIPSWHHAGLHLVPIGILLFPHCPLSGCCFCLSYSQPLSSFRAQLQCHVPREAVPNLSWLKCALVTLIIFFCNTNHSLYLKD